MHKQLARKKNATSWGSTQKQHDISKESLQSKKKPAIVKKVLLHYIDELESNRPPLPYYKIHLLNGGYCCYQICN